VTKGTNHQVMIESLYDIQLTVNDQELQAAATWAVEVVTDTFMDLTEVNSSVTQIVVPNEYVTPLFTQFKARALHYAAQNVSTHQDAWILHMDEES